MAYVVNNDMPFETQVKIYMKMRDRASSIELLTRAAGGKQIKFWMFRGHKGLEHKTWMPASLYFCGQDEPKD